MVNAGMDVKVLQYIMGHSEIDVTLNVYTHMGYEKAASHMIELIDGVNDFRTVVKAASVWWIKGAEDTHFTTHGTHIFTQYLWTL